MQIRNHIYDADISVYSCTNDAIGRRTAIARSGTMMSETRTDYYGYNDRNELVSAAKSGGAQSSATEYEYSYDDIGNRLLSFDLGTNRTYTANRLNQYTSISNRCLSASLREEFIPTFDLDGNQTLIQTATGLWQVSYNGENRPVLWECGTTNIVMKFDRMGRRVEYVEMVSGVTNTHHRFVCDGYVCIQRLNGAANDSIDLVFGWDPSEPVATRPLILQKYGQYSLFYTHDGNKNVSELVFFQQANGIAAHYEYAPFGAVTATSRSTPVTAYDFREYNPFKFSAEYADDTLGLVYYNYRHYNLYDGRWNVKDMQHEQGFKEYHENCNSSSISKAPFYEDYLFADNAPIFHYDYLGLSIMNPFKVGQVKFENCSECQLKTFRLIPENYKKGEELKEPGSGWNSSVDGVWVEGVQEWLKIPDHCYVTIICLDGCDFEYRWKCNALFSWIQKMRGKVSEVGFVPDQGETKHSTDYPF